MKSIPKTIPVLAFCTIVAMSSGPANACSLETDASYYGIMPYEDDGLSRAERVNCSLGKLEYYTKAHGWREMRDEQAQPLEAQDMAAVSTPAGELLVLILRDHRVAMRWGGPGNGAFFSEDDNHTAFYALDDKGEPLNGLRIGEVSHDPKRSTVLIGIRTNSAEYCEIETDPEYVLHWDRGWQCYPVPGTVGAESDESRYTGIPLTEDQGDSGLHIPVLVGGESDEDACGAYGEINRKSLNGRGMATVYAGPGAQYPMVDEIPIGSGVTMCETHPSGAWEGVVYPGERPDCGISSPLPRQPYLGPCKSGWIDLRGITQIAG